MGYHSISRGDYDFLAKKQVHVKKNPLERHKLFITQEANGSRPPKSIAAVSVNHSSDISTLTDTVGGLQASVNALIGLSMAQNCMIVKLKQIQKNTDIFESDDDTSDDKDIRIPSFSVSALAHGKLAGRKKRTKN